MAEKPSRASWALLLPDSGYPATSSAISRTHLTFAATEPTKPLALTYLDEIGSLLDAETPGSNALFDIVFFLGQGIVFFFVLIIVFFFVVVLVAIFVIVIFRDDIDSHWVKLHDLELGLAPGAIQNLAFFYFVLVHIHFNRAFGAVNHGRNLRPELVINPTRRIIYPHIGGGESTPPVSKESSRVLGGCVL
jgi:hypothetical protein